LTLRNADCCRALTGYRRQKPIVCLKKVNSELGTVRNCNDVRASNRQIEAIIRVATGNFLEMYDFMVFGYYASAIGTTFFPKTSSAASLMSALATFGAGFLMRPLGALVLGAYLDRKGRRTV
jgi:hypothetical protein